MNESFSSSLTVLESCLIAFPVGAASFWYSTRCLIDARSEAGYWIFGTIGVLAGVYSGICAPVALIILFCNGLSLWWLAVPVAAVIGLIIVCEQRIRTRQ